MGLVGTDRINVPLSNMVIGYEPQGFIVQDIFPTVPVGKQADRYYIWDKGDFFRIPETYRAPKDGATRIEMNISSAGYFCDNYALRHEEAFEDKANFDAILGKQQKRVRFLKNALYLDWENRVASVITSGSNVGSYTTLSGTSQWSDYTNSDPVNDVETGKESIRSTTGLLANTMILPHSVYRKLIHHPDIIDRIKYVQRGVVTREVLASVFEVDRILVGSAIKNTGSPGLSDSFSDIWGTNVVLAHITNGPDPDGMDPSLGYTFRWNAPELRTMPFAAEVWDDPNNRKFTNIQVGTYQDEVITASDLGYVIASAVA